VAELEIGLLGGFRVAVGTRVVPAEAWPRRKPAALVKLLALAPRHRLHRERLMDALWPNLARDRAAANLRKAVHHARRVLATVDGAHLIVSAGELICLPVERVWVDVEAFLDAAARARQARDAAAYAEALDLYRGGLLPDDPYEEWTIGPREELQSEFAALLEEQAGLLEARGDLEDAVRAAQRLVAVDPVREDTHVRLMRLYALAGRRTEALRQYQALHAVMRRELGIEPGLEAQQLYEGVRAGLAAEPELTSELWERVGELRVVAGDTGGAVKAFQRALDAPGSQAASARLHRKAAQAWLGQHEAEQAERHLRAAETLVSDPDERGRLVCLRANQAWERGDLDQAQRLGEEAREIALAAGEPDDVAAADEALAIVSHLRGDWRHGLHDEVERLSAGGVGIAPLARVFDIHHCIGQYHLYGDGLSDDVEDYARGTLALAEQAGAVRAQAFAWCLLGESLLLQARWQEAAGCLQRSCDLHASLGTRSGALPWQRLAELVVCRGTSEAADRLLGHASAIATVSPMAMHLWGRIHATAALAAVERGDPQAAARCVRAAAATAARYGDCPSCSALLNPVAAEAFAALGDGDGARRYAEAASEVAGLFESSAWRAMAAAAAASLATAGGNPSRAREGFEHAAELYERARQPFWAQRSRAQAEAARAG
jgi:DNA-binding SARP family transcriptional activator